MNRPVPASWAGEAPDLFETPLVSGFAYQPDLIPAEQEKLFVAWFETLDFRPFEFHGHLGNRRIVSFGWRYDYSAARIQKSEPLPDFLMPLRKIAGAFAQLDPAVFEHALVTEYMPGAGIGWHRDKPTFDHVVALSFLSPCRLRFRRRRDTGWDRRNLVIAPCSGYMLDGEARSFWEHSIPPLALKRYSVTFRDLSPNAGL